METIPMQVYNELKAHPTKENIIKKYHQLCAQGLNMEYRDYAALLQRMFRKEQREAAQQNLQQGVLSPQAFQSVPGLYLKLKPQSCFARLAQWLLPARCLTVK